MLVQHYVRRFSPELGRQVREVSPEAMERLRHYEWPGNIRELQSVLKQALLQASGTVLLPAFLPEPLGGPCEAAPVPVGRIANPSHDGGEEPGEETFVLHQRLGANARDLHAETHRQ